MNPIPAIVFALLTSTFAFVLYGAEPLGFDVPEFRERETSENPSVIEQLVGPVTAAFDGVVWTIQTIWQVVVLFGNVATFNIPGAPLWIRVLFTGGSGGVLVYAIARLIRGTA